MILAYIKYSPTLFSIHFQSIFGKKKINKFLLHNFWELNIGNKILDFGCGTGQVLDVLCDNYVYNGVDISNAYTTEAKKKYPFAKFFCSDLQNLLNNHQLLNEFSNSDVILCNGVLHHLKNDEIDDFFKLTSLCLNPHGKIFCFEPTFLLHQSTFSRVLVNLDRGMNVKHDHEWRVLFETHLNLLELMSLLH